LRLLWLINGLFQRAGEVGPSDVVQGATMRQVFQGAGEFSCSCWILMLGICCSINFVDLKTYRQQLTVLNNACRIV
jgi:hypothetical protein